MKQENYTRLGDACYGYKQIAYVKPEKDWKTITLECSDCGVFVKEVPLTLKRYYQCDCICPKCYKMYDILEEPYHFTNEC